MEQKPKGRPSTKPVPLKDGYYIELKNKGASSGIKLRKKNKQELEMAIKSYERSKIVVYLGQVKSGKWVDGKNKGKKTA